MLPSFLIFSPKFSSGKQLSQQNEKVVLESLQNP